MTTVKGGVRGVARTVDPVPLPLLLERLDRQLSQALRRQERLQQLRSRDPQVRGSAFRALTFIPEGGGRITDIAELAGVTKQALGQFVDVLERNGFVERRRDEADGRSRIVVRTRKGDRAAHAAYEVFSEIEDEWRRRVGARRWDTFRAVLVELTAELAPRSTGGESV
ncbi:MAG: MarR family winged helix-turn-helix transcriptional regulator [Nocardioidaceae bacterium]